MLRAMQEASYSRAEGNIEAKPLARARRASVAIAGAVIQEAGKFALPPQVTSRMATATDTDSVAAEHANGIATGFEWRFFDDEDGSVANGKNLHADLKSVIAAQRDLGDTRY